jgi:CheY-like chemotaxis protein
MKQNNAAIAPRLLVIDDEESILITTKLILEDLGCTVDTMIDPRAGLAQAIAADYDLIITDIKMPEMSGASLVRLVLENKPKARILAVTADPEDPVALDALRAGAIDILKKPFSIPRLLDFLQAKPASTAKDITDQDR